MLAAVSDDPSQCWFCSGRPAEAEAVLTRPFVAPRTLTEELVLQDFEIPRCAPCAAAHAEPEQARAVRIGFVVAAVLLAAVLEAVCIVYFERVGFIRAGMEWAAALAGGTLGAGLACSIDTLGLDAALRERCREAGARTPDDVLEYPPAAAFLAGA